MAALRSGWTAVVAFLLRRRFFRAMLRYADQKGGLLAAAVTYRALFAIFAAILLGFSVAALWLSSRSDEWRALLDAVGEAVPGLIGPTGIVESSELHAGIGLTTGTVSILALVWAAVSAIGNLRSAVRMIVGTAKESVPLAWLVVRDLLLAAAIAVLFVMSAAAAFVGGMFVDAVFGWFDRADTASAELLTRIVSIAATFLLDAFLVVLVFTLLSGKRASPRSLWRGALIGGVGLTVLQQLSGFFVRGAGSNPLLAGSASLIALLLWINLSVQVLLIACASIDVDIEESTSGEDTRVRTFAQRRVLAAERDLRLAERELTAAITADHSTPVRHNRRPELK